MTDALFASSIGLARQSCGNDGIRTDQRHAAGGDIELEVLIEVHVHDHADGGLDRVADVSARSDAGDVFPVGRRVAEPERVVLRLGIARIAQERIAVGQSRGILNAGMPLASAILIELNTARRRAVGDVADGHPARQREHVDRARPEIRSIGGGKNVSVVAEVDFDAIVGRQARPREMQNQKARSTGSRRRRRIEIDRPRVRRARRRAEVGPELDRGRYSLYRSGDVRHGIPFFLENGLPRPTA